MQEAEVAKVGHVRQFVNLDVGCGDVCATGCGQALELMKVPSVHRAVARETLCTRTTASGGAHSPHLPTAPHASTRTPLRALASNTIQRRGLDSSWHREFLLIQQREACGVVLDKSHCRLFVPVRLGDRQSDFRRQRRKAAASTSPPKERRTA